MKPIEITHYVEKSYGGSPSYIILMSDGIEYISNGCVFQPATEENLLKLTSKYRCGEYIDELLAADGIADDDLVNGAGMFMGCYTLTEAGEYPSLAYGVCMFTYCKLLTKPAICPELLAGDFMYKACYALETPGNHPKLRAGDCMYGWCVSLKHKGNYPELQEGTNMYLKCRSIADPDEQ